VLRPWRIGFKSRVLLILLSVSCAVASRAAAAPLLFEFEATVTEVCDNASHCGFRTSPLSPDEVVTGSFSYDPDTPPSEAQENTSKYLPEFPLAIQVNVAGTEVLGGKYEIEVTNSSSMDQMVVRGSTLGGSIPLDLEQVLCKSSE
jgi:hypothetical protein